MTKETEEKINSYLKYINTSLITIMVLIFSYSTSRLITITDEISKLNTNDKVKEIMLNNSNKIILDHEGRIRSLEKDVQDFQMETKYWVEENFEKKNR